MERRNSRSQSCQRESEKKGEQKSLLASFRDAVIDAVTPSWISMRSPTSGAMRDADDVATSDNLSSSSSRRLSLSQPNLYENGQPRTIDFSPAITSQGIPVQSGSRDFVSQGPSRGSPSQDPMQPGSSQSFLGQGFGQPGVSVSPTQPQSGSAQSTPVFQGFSELSVPADARNPGCSQTATPLGLGRTPKRPDFAQPGPSHGTPFPPPAAVPPVSEFTSSQLPLNRLVDKSDSVMAQDDTVSQRSHSSHSTSGCSSMAPQTNQGNRVPSQESAKRRRESGEFTVGTQTPPPQQQAKRPRLNVNISSVTHNHNTSYQENVTWTELHRRRMDDTPVRDRQPHFKPHLLGSPLGNTTIGAETSFSRRARSEDSRRMSDYYPGPTTYMGRYNYRDQDSQRMIDSLPRPGAIRSRSEQRGPDRKKSQWPYPVKVVPRPRVKPLHPEQQGEPVISETARKIMEVLDGMKTPLSDAKKIPVIVPDYWPTTRFSQEKPRTGGPPTRGMQVGGLADVVPNRQVYGRNPQPGTSGSPQPGTSGLQSSRARPAASNRAQDANNQALQIPSAAQVRGGAGSRESQDEGEDRQLLRARRRLPEPTSLRSAPTMPVGSQGPFNLPPVDFNLTTSPSGHHFQCTFSPNTDRRQPISQPSPVASGAFQFSQPIDVEATSQQGTNRNIATKTPQTITSGFSFSSPIKQGSPGVVSDTNTSKALAQGGICSTGTKFTDKSASLKDMLNTSPGVGAGGSGFSFKPADSMKNNSILDKLEDTGSKFSKPYHKPSRNSATNKLVNSDAGFGGFKPADTLKQGSVMDVLGGSGFKPAEKLKSGSVMDVLGKNSNSGFSYKPADQLKQGSVMDILGKSGSGFKPSNELKQGSVMDILGGSATTSTTDLKDAKSAATSTTGLAQTVQKTTGTGNTVAGTEPGKPASLASLFKTASGTWECGVCLIQNKPEATQCVACQTPKPGGKGPEKSDSKNTATDSSKSTSSSSFSGSSASEPASKSSSQDLSSMFKPQIGSWSCSVCLVQNKSESTQCVACQSLKPESKSESASKSSSQDLSSMFKPPTGTWSCLVCMIQNKPETTKCAACQTPKPEKKSASKPLPTGTPSSGWICDVCLVPNKGSDNACVACQSAKPVKQYEYPPGDWDCETCNFTNKEGAIRCCNCEYTRPGPPRTQCVPSVVKTFLDARNKERFGESTSVSNSTASVFGTAVSSVSGGTVTSSGFKMSGSTGTSSTSGFKFGNTVATSESKPLGTGFQFGSATSKSEPQSLGTGFKFGAPAGSEKTPSTSVSTSFGSSTLTSVSSGTGFQFGTPASKQSESAVKISASDDSQSKGFEASATPSSSGFAFGSPLVTASAKVTSSQTTSSLTSSLQSSATSAPLTFNFGSVNKSDLKLGSSSASTTVSQTGFPASSIGGFNFSVNKTSTVTVNSVQSTVCSTAPTGGFTFSSKPSGTSGPSSTPADKAAPAQPTPATGGFNFTSAQSAPVASSVFGGFNATQKPTETAEPQKPKPTENAAPAFGAGGFSFSAGSTGTAKQPAFGGFNSAPKPAENATPNATPAFGGFNFKPAQTEAPKIEGFGFSATQGQSTSFGQQSSAKRSVEDDTSGESSAKKAPAFNFGAAASTNTSFQMPASTNENKSLDQLKSTSNEQQDSKAHDQQGSKSNNQQDTNSTDQQDSKAHDQQDSKSNDAQDTISNDQQDTDSTDQQDSKSNDQQDSKARDQQYTNSNDQIDSNLHEQLESKDDIELDNTSHGQLDSNSHVKLDSNSHGRDNIENRKRVTWKKISVRIPHIRVILPRIAIQTQSTRSCKESAEQSTSASAAKESSESCEMKPSSSLIQTDSSDTSTRSPTPERSSGSSSRNSTPDSSSRTTSRSSSSSRTSSRSNEQAETTESLANLKSEPKTSNETSGNSTLASTETTTIDSANMSISSTQTKTTESPPILAITEAELTSSGQNTLGISSQVQTSESPKASTRVDTVAITDSAITGSTQTSSRCSSPTRSFQMPLESSVPSISGQTSQEISAKAAPASSPTVSSGAGSVFVFGRQSLNSESKPSASARSGPITLQNLGDLMKLGSQVARKQAKQSDSEEKSGPIGTTNPLQSCLQNLGGISRFEAQDSLKRPLFNVASDSGRGRSTPDSQISAMEADQNSQHADLNSFSFGTRNIPSTEQPVTSASQPIAQEQAPKSSTQNLMPSLGDLMKFGTQSLLKSFTVSKPPSASSEMGSQASSRVFVFGSSGQCVEKSKQSKLESETPSTAAQNNAQNPVIQHAAMTNLGTENTPELESAMDVSQVMQLTSSSQSCSHPSTGVFVFGSSGQTTEKDKQNEQKSSQTPQNLMPSLGDLMKFGTQSLMKSPTVSTPLSASSQSTATAPPGVFVFGSSGQCVEKSKQSKPDPETPLNAVQNNMLNFGSQHAATSSMETETRSEAQVAMDVSQVSQPTTSPQSCSHASPGLFVFGSSGQTEISKQTEQKSSLFQQATTQNLMPSLGDLMKFGAQNITKTPPTQPVSTPTASQTSSGLFVFGAKGQTVDKDKQEKAEEREPKSSPPSNKAVNFFPNLGELMSTSQSGSRAQAMSTCHPATQSSQLSSLFVFGSSQKKVTVPATLSGSPATQQASSLFVFGSTSKPANDTAKDESKQPPQAMKTNLMNLGDLMKFGIPDTEMSTSTGFPSPIPQSSGGLAFSMDNTVSMAAKQSGSSQAFRLAYHGFIAEAMDADFEKSNSSFASMQASFYDEADFLRDCYYSSDSSRSSSSSSSVSRKSSRSHHRSRRHKKSSKHSPRSSRHSSASSMSRSPSRSLSQSTGWLSKSRRTSKSSLNSRSSSSVNSRRSSVSSRNSSRSSSRGRSHSRGRSKSRRSRSGSSRTSSRSSQSSRERSKTPHGRKSSRSPSCHRSESATNLSTKDDKSETMETNKNDNKGTSRLINASTQKKPLTASLFGGTKEFAQDTGLETANLSRAGTGLFGCFDPLSRTRKDNDTTRPNILTPSAFGRTNTLEPSTAAKPADSSVPRTMQQSTPSRNVIVFGGQDAFNISSNDAGKLTETVATPKCGAQNLMPSLGELMKGGIQNKFKKDGQELTDAGTVNIPASDKIVPTATVVKPPSICTSQGEDEHEKEQATQNDAGTVNIPASSTATTNNGRAQCLIPSLGDLMTSGLQGGLQKEPPGPSNVGTVNIPTSGTVAANSLGHQDLLPSLGDLMKNVVQGGAQTEPVRPNDVGTVNIPTSQTMGVMPSLEATITIVETHSVATTNNSLVFRARPSSLMPSLGELMKSGLPGIKQSDKPGSSESGIQKTTLQGGPTRSIPGAVANDSTVLQTTAGNGTLQGRNTRTVNIPVSQTPVVNISQGILNGSLNNIQTQHVPVTTSGPEGSYKEQVDAGTVNIPASQTLVKNAASQCTTAPGTEQLNAGSVNISAPAAKPSLDIAPTAPHVMNSGIIIPEAPPPPMFDTGQSRILQAPPAPCFVPNILPATEEQSRILQAPPPPPLQLGNTPTAENTELNTEMNISDEQAPMINFGHIFQAEPRQPDFGFAVPQIPSQPIINGVPTGQTLLVVNGPNSTFDGMSLTQQPQFFSDQNDMQAASNLPFSSYAPTSQKSKMECGTPSPSPSKMSCVSQLSPRKMVMSPVPSPQPALMVMSQIGMQSPQVSPRKMAISPQFSPSPTKMAVSPHPRVSPRPGLSNMETQVQNIPVVISPVNRGLPLFRPLSQPGNIRIQNIILPTHHYANRTIIPLPAPPIRLPAPPPSNVTATPLDPPQQAEFFSPGLQHAQPQAPATSCLRPPTCVHFGAQSTYSGSIDTGTAGTSLPPATSSSTFGVTADRNIAACGQNLAQSQVQPSHESSLRSPGTPRKAAGVRFNPSATKVEYPACEYSQHDHGNLHLSNSHSSGYLSGYASGYASGYTSDSSMADVLAEIAAEQDEEALNPNGHFAKFFRREMERKKRERDRGKRGMKGPKKTKRKRSPPPASLPSPPRSRSPSPENWRSTSPEAVSKRMCMKSDASTSLNVSESQGSSRTVVKSERISDGCQVSFDVPISADRFKTEDSASHLPGPHSVESNNQSSAPDKSCELNPEPSTSTGGPTGRSGTKRRPWRTNSKEKVVTAKPSVIRISRRISFQDGITPPRPPAPPEVKKRSAEKEDEMDDNTEPPEKRPSLTIIFDESKPTKKSIIKLSQPKKKSPPPRPPPPRPPTPDIIKRKGGAVEETADIDTQPPRKIPEPDPSTVEKIKSKAPSPPFVKKSSVHAYLDENREERKKKEKRIKNTKVDSGSASPSSSNSSDSSEATESVSVLQAWARLRIASASAINVSASSTSMTTAKSTSTSAIAAKPTATSKSASVTACASSSSASVASFAASNTNQNANTGGFAFGAQATSTPAAPFVFGAQQPAAQTPTPAAPAPSVPQSFNFSATPNLNFTASAAPAPGSFAFSATPTSSDSSKRVVKKAVRRLKR